MPVNLDELRETCAIQLLELYKKANAGHIGASLSCLEILIQAFAREMKPEDQFILSKGHAAGALYVVLKATGRLEGVSLDTFYKDDTWLAAHPPCGRPIASIPFGTGSLGHGLSLAAGLCFSQRFTDRAFRTYCVLSEGDCNEGSTWEAALFAGHHGLENLLVVVDANGLQGLGAARDILDMNPIEAKWREFGFETVVCDAGNNFNSLDQAFRRFESSAKPKCIVAKTVKGHGVSYMENEMSWHYLPMTDAQYERALIETRGRRA